MEYLHKEKLKKTTIKIATETDVRNTAIEKTKFATEKDTYKASYRKNNYKDGCKKKTSIKMATEKQQL